MTELVAPYTPPADRSLFRRENLVVLLLTLVGLTMFATRYAETQPSARIPIQVDRDEAGRLALAHLQELGYATSELSIRNVSYQSDPAWSAFLQSEVDDAAPLRTFRPDAWWAVVLNRTNQVRPILLRLTPAGEVFSVNHPLPETRAGARLSPTQALGIASTFLQEVAHTPLTGWTLQNSRVDQLGGRSDHTLTWNQPIPGADGSFRTLRLVVAGDAVSSWSRAVELSPEFRSRFGPKETLHTFMDFGLLLLVILVWVAAMVVFALRFRSSEIGLRNGILVVFALILVFVWFGFNTSPYTAYSAVANPQSPFQLAFVYIGVSIQVFLTSLGLFFVWNAGESVSREVWPAKLGAFDKLFAQRFFTRDIGAGILRGFAMASISLGLWFTLVPLIADGQWTVIGQEELMHLSAIFPPGLALGAGLMTGLLVTAYAYLFTLGLLRWRTRRTWIAVLATAILFGVFFSETTVIFDRRVGAVLSVIVGLAGYWFFLRYDLWTVFCGSFFSGLLLGSALYVVHPAFQWEGVLGLATAGLAVLYGAAAVYRGKAVADGDVSPTYVRHISERERLKFELDIARQAQLRMLPAQVPEPTGLEVAAFSEPAREVGGDYYDFLELPGNRLGIVVGDVSGKGMSAALYMTMLKGYLQSRFESDQSPLSVLAHVNRMFGQSSDRAMFATMILCVFDIDRKVVTFARAGHCPLLVYRPTDSSVYVLQPQGIGIGLERSDLFERLTREESLDLRAGDVILMYSDGIPEARDSAGNEFGRQRLIDLLRENAGSAEEVLARIRDAHRRFVSGEEPHDDLTCVVVRLTADERLPPVSTT
ncbi:MAG: PP2C family protein-serine/threonine phosphatase [Rhodothermales bacterium]|nr:PP2C family protein-serine/threonine phosphatase [Rhodothermales bacterium]